MLRKTQILKKTFNNKNIFSMISKINKAKTSIKYKIINRLIQKIVKYKITINKRFFQMTFILKKKP